MENKDDPREAPSDEIIPFPSLDGPPEAAVVVDAATEVPFENLVQSVADLPRLAAPDFVPLDPAYRSYEYVLTTFLFGGMFATYLVILLLSASWPSLPWLLGSFGLFALAYAAAMLLVFYGYRVAGYALRTHDVAYRRGVIFRKQTVIPFNRVQHCEVNEGPLERGFGLATLQVYTAGGQSSDLTIKGLRPGEARRLKDYISAQIAAVDED